MSTPGLGSILGSSIIYGSVDSGPTFGRVYRPLNQKRIFTAAGNDTIQPYDQLVIYKKTVPAAFNVQLPDLALWLSQPWGLMDLILKDGARNSGTFPISVFPFGSTQQIDGMNAATLVSGYKIQGDGASLILTPLADASGWILQ
jgi:hypothetical protein